MQRRTLPLGLLAILLFSSLTPLISSQIRVDLTMDKIEYNPGDILIVSGTTGPNLAVVIQVFNPQTVMVGIAQDFADSQGNFAIEVLNFPEELGNDFQPGEYRIKATAEGASNETIITLVNRTPQPTPPPIPVPILGENVEVEQMDDRYVFITKNESIRYRIEVFNDRPEVTVTFESPLGFFNQSNKVSVEMRQLIEFVDVDGDQLYTNGIDVELGVVNLEYFTWNHQFFNRSTTRFEYQVILTGSESDQPNQEPGDPETLYRVEVNVTGGKLSQLVTYQILNFEWSNDDPSTLLAIMMEGRGESEMAEGPGEIGFNIPVGGTILSPFYTLDTLGSADAIQLEFLSKITHPNAEVVVYRPDSTQKLIYITVPRFDTFATHIHRIGVRAGAPVPEFPPLGLFLSLVILVPFIILVSRTMRRSGHGVTVQDTGKMD